MANKEQRSRPSLREECEPAPQTATRLTGSANMRLSLSVALVPCALGATQDAGCPGT